jgi:hypothetical protein
MGEYRVGYRILIVGDIKVMFTFQITGGIAYVTCKMHIPKLIPLKDIILSDKISDTASGTSITKVEL